NGIVETGEDCDVFGGCAGGYACSETCACQPATPPVPGTLALIAQALAAGRIDYPTSLLLRGKALVGDEGLPPEYDGDFALAEDTALFVELSRAWGSLTDAQQAALRPYVARPTEPDSVYSQPPASPAGAPADMPPPIACPKNTDTGAADWRFTASDHFVVWSCGGGDPAADPYAGKRDVAKAMAEEIWGLETPGLGAPRADDFPVGPEPRSRID